MATDSVKYLEILTTAGLAIGFTAFIALVGAPVVTRVAPRFEQLRSGQGIFVFGLVLCLGLSVAATYIENLKNELRAPATKIEEQDPFKEILRSSEEELNHSC